MRRFVFAAAMGAGALALGSCATMNEAQCLAGEWSGQGYADGLAGHGWGRLDEHRQACARHGVAPDDAAYYAGHERGVRDYCRPGRGFSIGRDGGGYTNGFCPADLEQDFLIGLADGRLVWDARQRVDRVASDIQAHRNRAQEIENEIRALEDQMGADGVTEDQRRNWRERIRRLRNDREGHLVDARDRERDLDNARRELNFVQNRFIPVYGDR
jgi:hypothetical protein